MIVYGLFFGEHNFSTALIVDGEIKYATENEKITRIKSAYNLFETSYSSLVAIEEASGIKLEDADLVAIGDATLFHKQDVPDITKERTKLLQDRIKNCKEVKVYTHHEAHAASAYYLAGFPEKTLVVTSDGGSFENVNGSIYMAEDGNLHLFKNLYRVENGSLGNLWCNICPKYGFKGLKDEGKIMGMAANGSFVQELFDNFIRLTEYDNNFGFTNGENTDLINQTFWKMDEDGWFNTQQKRETVAYNLQKSLEYNLTKYFKHLKKSFPQYKKLCLAGGLFANVKSNQIINEECGFDEIFIAPPMGDEGCALGAALLGARDLGDWEHRPTKDVFFGLEYSNEECDIEAQNWDFEVVGKDTDYDLIAQLLKERNVVAVHKGKLEFGPRALGNRSVMMETTDPTNHVYLNKRFGRNEVMPFAPFVMKEKANEIFHITKSTFAAEFMTLCYSTREEWEDKIPAVIQKSDKTARPQLVTEEKHNFFYNVVKAYDKLTGIPVLLNTSFNGHGEPIIDTPAQAFSHLDKGSIDYLVIGDKIYKKK